MNKKIAWALLLNSLLTVQLFAQDTAVADPAAPEPTNELWHTLYYETASHLIDADYEPVIKSMAAFLKQNPKVTIQITGHTDHVGGYKYNQNLSYRRASTVQQAISAEGIALERIQIDWYGYTQPAVANATSDSEKQQNRRVMIFKITPAPEPLPDVDLQDFYVSYGENDKFDVIITYECENIETFYGDWKQNCKVTNKGAEQPAIDKGALEDPDGQLGEGGTKEPVKKEMEVIYQLQVVDENGNPIGPKKTIKKEEIPKDAEVVKEEIITVED